MKILILGATGRTGRLVLKLAKEKGWEITCLVRDASKLNENNNIKLIEGTPERMDDLEKVVRDIDAIISILNISRNSDFPWSSLRTPQDLLSKTISNLLTLNKSHSFKRMIVCSAWGAGETRKYIPFWFRWMIDFSNIGKAYKDHERQERLLENSDIDWTIVRPVGLINAKKIKPTRKSFNNKPKPDLFISRKEVANFMVQAIENRELIRKKVVISR